MIYVMSDIHGDLKRFNSMLKKISLCSDDTLYILGDVIDRYPYGIEILQLILDMPNVKMLLGNHELMMLQVVTRNVLFEDYIPSKKYLRIENCWYSNGGKVTHEHFNDLLITEQTRIITYLKSLPVNLDVIVSGTKYRLVHGAPIENYGICGNFYNSINEYAVWEAWMPSDPVPDGYTLVFGHTPTININKENPLAVFFSHKAIGIDCGCGFPKGPLFEYDGRLACVRLNDMKVFYSDDNDDILL